MIEQQQLQAMLKAILRRTGSAIVDDDLAQEVALRVLEALRRVPEVANPSGFCRKVIEDAVRDHWRSMSRHRERLTLDVSEVEEHWLGQMPTIDDDIDRQRRNLLLELAIRSLTPDQQTHVELFYNQGLSLSQIAERQRRTLSSVKMTLLRSRRQIAQFVAEKAAEKSR